MHWLTVQEHFNDLVVATYGRGFWILDDLTPLQQLTPQVRDVGRAPVPAASGVPLPLRHGAGAPPGRRPPRAGTRWGCRDQLLPEAHRSRSHRHYDQRHAGQPVRTLRGTGEAGINRVWWDLRYDTPASPTLWTPPPGHDHVPVPPEGRPFFAWQNTHARAWAGESGVLVAPGTYTVKLSAGTNEAQQTLTVKRDPTTTGTDADIAAQTAMVLSLRADIDEVVRLINTSELVRKQLADVRLVLSRHRPGTSALTLVEQVDRKLMAFGNNLFQMESTGYQDGLRTPRRLYEKLLQLIFDVGTDGADFAPTTQQAEVRELYRQQLGEYKRQLVALLETDVNALNHLLREQNIPNIVMPSARPTDGYQAGR